MADHAPSEGVLCHESVCCVRVRVGHRALRVVGVMPVMGDGDQQPMVGWIILIDVELKSSNSMPRRGYKL